MMRRNKPEVVTSNYLEVETAVFVQPDGMRVEQVSSRHGRRRLREEDRFLLGVSVEPPKDGLLALVLRQASMQLEVQHRGKDIEGRDVRDSLEVHNGRGTVEFIDTRPFNVDDPLFVVGRDRNGYLLCEAETIITNRATTDYMRQWMDYMQTGPLNPNFYTDIQRFNRLH